MTLEICVLSAAVDFANIVATPLLLGIGVASRSTMWWRGGGRTNLLHAASTRAIFSAR